MVKYRIRKSNKGKFRPQSKSFFFFGWSDFYYVDENDYEYVKEFDTLEEAEKFIEKEKFNDMETTWETVKEFK